MKAIIGGEEYEYIERVAENAHIRDEFLAAINEAFGFDFSRWQKAGLWTDKYEPHVLVKDGKVVSTVTANHMKYLFGEVKSYVQIGGVFTREEYRKKGLAAWLMHRIIDKYQSACGQIFLFSDDDAKEFYPKMGFEAVTEYIGKMLFGRSSFPQDAQITLRKMNISLQSDRKLLLKCYAESNPFSAFPSIDCAELVVFYGLEFKKDCYFYIPELGMAIVAEPSGAGIFISDIYGAAAGDDPNAILVRIVYALAKRFELNMDSVQVSLGFSPKSAIRRVVLEPIIEKDDTTFLLSGKENIFAENKLRFPILSHN